MVNTKSKGFNRKSFVLAWSYSVGYEYAASSTIGSFTIACGRILIQQRNRLSGLFVGYVLRIFKKWAVYW